ncbi:hypothetical protein BDA99DRAFT_337362 [Phascolomyces articulosus]|uniref:F-box domain-containing protein n=1 Tax=Phascolomyces articulosus TaxID=60185 RepID=A0AAD5PG25_9FUNG|nr:hypothetical protein BDA99DRAFT_337362 [Phascolomyces articulosus]
MLEMRAIAWGRKDDYDKELQDASAMIKFAPHDPTGYLITGRRYAQQGFPKRAIKIFNKGLEQALELPHQTTTAATTDKKQTYLLLLQEKQRAQKQWDDQSGHFFAFISYDLICCIIDFLPQESIIECLLVSSTWRDWILSYPKPWRHAFHDATNKNSTIKENGIAPIPYPILPSVSQHVEYLAIPPDRHGMQYLDLIQTKNFSNLLSLKISDTGSFNIRQNNQMPLYLALHSVTDTLVSLDITFKERTNVPALGLILSTCSNLSTLRFSAYEINIVTPFSLSNVTTVLTQLELVDTQREGIQGEQLKSILRACPYLHYLSINKCETDIYNLVLNHCPNIHTLVAGGYSSLWSEPTKWSMFPLKSTIRNNGLNRLTIGNDVSNGNEMLPLLEEYHDTLDRLALYQAKYRTQLMETNWQHLASLGFTHLTHFTIVDITQIVCNNLKILLASMPNLASFRLQSLSGPEKIPDGALFALSRKRLPKLSELSLLTIQVNPVDLCHLLGTFCTITAGGGKQEHHH